MKEIELSAEVKAEFEERAKEMKGEVIPSYEIAKKILEEDNQKEKLKEGYDALISLFKEYIDTTEENYKLLTIWTIGSWFHSSFPTYPYLYINATKGAAKSRTIRLITHCQEEGEVIASPTEAVLFRQNNPIGIDEFEKVGKKEYGNIRELLNMAYKKGNMIKRAKKVKSLNGSETHLIETFEVYRAICLANIWGMEEVLESRCITIFLEKSTNPLITKLIENFGDNEEIKEFKLKLSGVRCSLCRVVSFQNIYKEWNSYIKTLYTTTLNYIPTGETYTPTNYTHQDFFEKINATGINGRELELFLPLFLIASLIDGKLTDDLIKISETFVAKKNIEEITESKDILLYSFVSKQGENEYRRIKELTYLFRTFVGDDEEDDRWLNEKWVGRALKRLQLSLSKRRVGEGIEVILNVPKAKEKMRMFE